jgi:hypothetical protein
MTSEHDKPLEHLPGETPSSPILWPVVRGVSNTVQQTKTRATPQSANVLPTTQPAAASVPSRTTPAHVSRIRIVSKVVGASKQITVRFAHPPGDSHYQGSTVYLKRGTGQPTQVASGAQSPLTFTVAKSAAPHSIFVSSWGPWGETNPRTSPSARVRLS